MSNMALKITDGNDRRKYLYHTKEAEAHNLLSRRLSADVIRSNHHKKMSLRHYDQASEILSKYDSSFKT